MILDLGVA